MKAAAVRLFLYDPVPILFDVPQVKGSEEAVSKSYIVFPVRISDRGTCSCNWVTEEHDEHAVILFP